MNQTKKTLSIYLAACLLICFNVCEMVAAITVVQQSNVTVSGVVKDETGEPIIGANVIVTGTTVGQITDLDGKFSISVPPNATLRISYVGYLSQDVKISAGKTTYEIVLREDSEALEEVVVIGYGTVKKSDVTGSVVSVSADDMLKTNPTAIVTGLQGAAAGVLVTRDGGPSGGSKIRIRGIASVNNATDPLFVVDGIRVGTNIDYLNPADVHSIEILKDASATAIYGSEGANGVIMVTTRKGEAGRARVNFSANYSVVSPAVQIDVLDAPGFAKAAHAAAVANGGSLNTAWWNHGDELHTIDWQDEMSQNALRQNYALSITGGSEATRAVLSLGYTNNDGIIIHQNYQRLTSRLHIDHTIKKVIRTGASIAYTYNRREGLGSRMMQYSMLQYASVPPTMDDTDQYGNLIHVPIQRADGSWGHFFHTGNDVNKSTDNPVAAATDSKNAGNFSYSGDVIASAYVDIDLFKGLTFRSNASTTYRGWANSNYRPINARPQINMNDDFDQYEISNNSNVGLSVESYLTYRKNIGGMHDLTVMAGHSVMRNFGSRAYTYAKYLPVPTVRRIEMTQDRSTIRGEGGLNDENRMESFFGRLNYSLKDRYLLTATVRRDGSSNFGAGNRYGIFPSVSLAWRLMEESFIKNLNIFSNLKLRAGWGQTGNAGFGGSNAIDQLSSSRIAYYYYNGSAFVIAPGLAQMKEIDTNLKWETNEQTNIGLDFGFAKNMLSFSVDYYVRNAKDLLLNRTLRPSSGYDLIYTNAGQIRNSGFEVAAAFQKPVGDWFFNVRVNASTNKNEAVDVGLPIYETVGNGDWWNNCSITENGKPIGSYYGHRVEGIFQSKEEIDALNAVAKEKGLNGGYYQMAGTSPGDFKFKDLDGNGVIDDLDRDYLGHGFPTLNYGLNLTASYKGWDATLYIYGLAGQDILSYAYKNLTTMRPGTEGYQNILREYAQNAWTSENRSTKYQRLTRQDDNHNTRVSDYYLMNGDFLKIRNIQIGYSLPKNVLKTLMIDNLRVFVSAEDLFTFTSYPAKLDPELPIGNNTYENNTLQSVLTTGVDQGHYPLPRSFTLGLTVGF